MNFARAMICLVLTLLATPAFGQACVEYSDYLGWVESNCLVMSGRAIATSGDRAYVMEYSSLNIVDIGDPRFPELISETALPSGGSKPIAVWNDWVFCGGDSIMVFDASDPAAPLHIHTLPWAAEHMTLAQDFFGDEYLCASDTEVATYPDTTHIAIYQLALDTPPALVNTLSFSNSHQAPSNGSAIGLASTPTALYVGFGCSFSVIAFYQGSQATVIQDYALTPWSEWSSTSMVIEGERLIFGAPRLHIYDISLPLAPSLTSWAANFAHGGDLRLEGDRLYAAGNGLEVLDITDPTDPQPITTLGHGLNEPRLARAGQHLLLVGQGTLFSGPSTRLQIADLSGIDTLAPHAVIELPHRVEAPKMIRGDHLYCSGSAIGDTPSLIFDISDEWNPVQVGSWSAQFGRHHDLGYLGLILGGGHDLSVYDFTDPLAPTLAAGLDAYGYVTALAVKENTAFLACYQPDPYEIAGDYWIRRVDISDPAAPALIDSLDMKASDLAVIGDCFLPATSGHDEALI